MKNREEFLKELNALVISARENGNQITVDQVKNYFSETDLTEGQIELVFDYLLAQKVVVKGYVKVSSVEEKAEITYTEDEKAYLEGYLQELQAFKDEALGEREALFEKMVQGNGEATERLIELYLPVVVDIAKDMHHPDIFIGDMIQEGGVGLIMGINQIEDVQKANQTICTQIRQSIQMMIEEYETVNKSDNKMLEQVNMLDQAIKELTDELGRKVTMDELAIHIGMTEEEIMDILRLMGEDAETEEDA